MTFAMSAQALRVPMRPASMRSAQALRWSCAERMGVIGGEDEEPEDHRDMKEGKQENELVQIEAQEEKQLQQVQVDTLKVKWWVWAILISALFAVSSAATALRALNVPPLLKASWRLQSTSLLLAVGFCYQLFKLLSANATNQTSDYSLEIKQRYFTFKTFGILGLSGSSLALHFGCWVVSLNYTSLAHSLLLVTCHPILIVLGSVVLRKPISRGEIIGSVGGFAGLVLTLLDTFLAPSSGSDAAGASGDLLAFIGALAIIVYLYGGSNLRSWVALYLYAFPVTFLSALLLLFASLIIEKDALSYGIFGWFSSEYFLVILYLAIVPGFVGHTGINAILKYVEPVVISVTLLIEPVIGSFIGYFFHQSGLPGLFTFLGGPIIIAGCIVVTISAYKRSQSTTSAATPIHSTSESVDDVSTRTSSDILQSTDKLLVGDVGIAKEDSEKIPVRQTTKYEKLRDEIELDVIVNDTGTKGD